jgi:hypothetical protein
MGIIIHRLCDINMFFSEVLGFKIDVWFPWSGLGVDILPINLKWD